MKFTGIKINSSTKAVLTTYEDEFQTEDFEIVVSEYFLGKMFVPEDFEKEWNAFDSLLEKNGSFQLPYKTVELAVKGLIAHFGNFD